MINLIVDKLSSATVSPEVMIDQARTSNEAPIPQQEATARPQLQLPGPGRGISEFAKDLGIIMAPKKIWFKKAQQVVEVRTREFSESLKTVVFHPLLTIETRTVVEDHVETGHWKQEEDGNRTFSQQTMSTETASAVLVAPQLLRELPVVERILDVSIPFIHEGNLIFAKKGYDDRLRTYCRQDAPEISDMPLDQAKELLRELQQDFCFANGLSVTLSTARLLTPMCRGLMGWSSRPPVWLFEGNRPRAGKDYLAGCTALLYEGRVNEDAPLETEGEETKKRLGAALQSGRRFMHFANCQGFVQNSAFEHAATAKTMSFRALGKNDASADLTLPNEIEFSLSANTGFGFTEDFNLRCRKISLHYSEEDSNGRKFSKPDLHGWVLDHRNELLSALAALIRHWDEQNRPEGPTGFTSFPEWARVVGGIMSCCGLGDPCQLQEGSLTGNWVENDMKALYRLAYTQHPDAPLKRQEIYTLISGQVEGELFSLWDLSERRDQTKLGKVLKKYEGRVLDGIQMTIDSDDQKRPKCIFTKQVKTTDKGIVDKVFHSNQAKNGYLGYLGYLGNIYTQTTTTFPPTTHNTCQVATVVKVPEVPNVPTTSTIILPGDGTLPMTATAEMPVMKGPPKPPACVYENPPPAPPPIPVWQGKPRRMEAKQMVLPVSAGKSVTVEEAMKFLREK